MELSPRAGQPEDSAKLKAFFGKENIHNGGSYSVAKKQPLTNQKPIAVPKPQTTSTKVFFTPKKHSLYTSDSPFSLKLMKIDSPMSSNWSGPDSPHFAKEAPSEKYSASAESPFFTQLSGLIALDHELICMKNILCNRNSSIREKQQYTLKELEYLLPKKELEVSFEEFDPFLKKVDDHGNIVVPTATAFVAVYGKAYAAFIKLFEACTKTQIKQLYDLLDFNSKGYVDLYDFTRYTQLKLGASIKPQSVYLLVRRLSSSANGRVTLADMLAHSQGVSGLPKMQESQLNNPLKSGTTSTQFPNAF